MENEDLNSIELYYGDIHNWDGARKSLSIIINVSKHDVEILEISQNLDRKCFEFVKTGGTFWEMHMKRHI